MRPKHSLVCSASASFLLLLPVLLGTASGCANGNERPAGPRQTVVRVPSTWPQQLAVADDGSLWMTGKYLGLKRLAPGGRVTEHTIGKDFSDFALDLVRGPDGAMWFTADRAVGRIDSAGKVTTWRLSQLGLPNAITAADGSLWFTNEAVPGRIERVSIDGELTGFRVTGERRFLSMPGIAHGPDGALWFTQSGYTNDPADGIGRMTIDGRYKSWPLARRRAGVTSIVAGDDGALWFAERDAHAIGRITTRGAISEFPLRTGLSPYDITAASDGALWFVADSCIGRITTSGEVTSWPVRGAGRLVAIAGVPDGSFWLADDIVSAVWRFTPPAEGSVPRAACRPPSITRRSGATQATLVYRRLDRFAKDDFFTDARIALRRGGRVLLTEAVPPSRRALPEYGVFGNAAPFAVRDLDGDREPEVLLELHWNGTHCCHWSRVYRYDAVRKTYVPGEHFWGNSTSAPRLKDLDADGRPEFVSRDDRFAYSFDGYAGSVRPIRIWSYDRGRFHDVTRRYPRQIKRDAAEIWRLYVRHRGKRSVRGIIPAWAADQYMLGRGAVVERALEQARRRGYLSCRPSGSCFGEPPDSAGYIRALERLLRRTGYIPG